MTALEDMAGVGLKADRLLQLRHLAQSHLSVMASVPIPNGLTTRRTGPGLEVAETRAYTPGDDTRHLDPAATARTGRLHVRAFREERDQVTLLLADFRAAMFWGVRRAFRSVAAAEVLALIGWQRVAQGGRVGLLAITPNGPVVVAPRARHRGMVSVITGLVEAHGGALQSAVAERAPGTETLAAALVRAKRLVPTGGEVVIASGFDDAEAGTGKTGLADRLDDLSQRRSARLILVTAAQPGELPAGRYPMRLDADNVVQVRVQRGSQATPRNTQIAGRAALVINAADPIAQSAARLWAGQDGRAA